MPVSVLGALPMVLATVQVWTPSTPAGLLTGALHALTGLAGSLAFIAIVGLVVAARQGRGDTSRASDGVNRGVVGALAAVGRRSLTCYLLQSLVFVPLMAPWAGGLGVGAGTAFAASVGVGAYLASVALALALERAGRPGPAEVLLRRLTYGHRPPGGGRCRPVSAGRSRSPAPDVSAADPWRPQQHDHSGDEQGSGRDGERGPGGVDEGLLCRRDEVLAGGPQRG